MKLGKIRNILKGFELKLANFLHYADTGMFNSILIETQTQCNRRCACCPVGHKIRPKVQMSETLFSRIIGQLAEKDYCGEIGFHSYNEPLMDPRLPEFIRQARDQCPKSFLYFHSNGDFLDREKFKKLIENGLGKIFVTQYDEQPTPQLAKFLAEVTEPEKRFLDHLVALVDKHQWSNRAGSVPHLKINAPLNQKCIRPEYQLVIEATGRVAQCASDYEGVGLGNARISGIKGVFGSATP